MYREAQQVHNGMTTKADLMPHASRYIDRHHAINN